MSTANYPLLDLVVTASEMAGIDREAIAGIGIPGAVLMESAGRKVLEVIKSYAQIAPGDKVVILCGKGNNAGDGFVVARYLVDLGAHISLCGTDGCEIVLKGDAELNWQIFQKLNAGVLPGHAGEHDALLNEADLVVDALLGTGVTGPLRPNVAQLVETVNAVHAPVVAIDLPTGMHTDTGEVPGACVRADWTVTMGHLKRGLLFSPAREHAGQVFVADIGFPTKVSQDSGVHCFRTNAKYVRSVLPERRADTFKNRCGQVLVLAGSVGMTGAAALASQSSLRVGAGLTILGIAGSLNAILEEKLTEVMTLPLPETEGRSLSFAAAGELAERLEWAGLLAVGPGISVHPETTQLVKWLVETFDKPMVLDADALNGLAQSPGVLKKSKADLVLTPHPGELARLTGENAKEIVRDPVEAAKRAAAGLGAVVVLKGAPTVIASPEGYVFINSTGNPGMATGGMGDVLTGVIAGLIAQGMSTLDGAIAGVYLHGLAGDMAAEQIGQAGMLAGDVADLLPTALKDFETRSDRRIQFI